jgi:glycosyltransferase involved in cell wall biosynthesis
LVPADDAPALAGAIRSWLTGPELRRRLITAAADRRQTLPDWPATAATVASVLASVAAA